MLNVLSNLEPSIYIIHENQEWTKPLCEELKKMNVPFEDWDMSHSILDISAKAPQGIFYNRMSASSHTRGNRFAPESTIGLLAWLEAQNCCVINGRSALNLEISKLVQYASLSVVGLNVPSTIAVTKKEDLIDAYNKFFYKDVITKHNRAGKGLGVQLLKSKDAVFEYVNGEQFSESIDGITLMQQYIKPINNKITRVEFIGGEFVYAVNVDTSDGFELCPADACEVGQDFCPTDTLKRNTFEIDLNFENSDIGQKTIPKMKQLMKNEGINVAAFEFVCDENSKPYFYDINTNTNYNSDAEKRANVSAMKSLAIYLKNSLYKLSQDNFKKVI